MSFWWGPKAHFRRRVVDSLKSPLDGRRDNQHNAPSPEIDILRAQMLDFCSVAIQHDSCPPFQIPLKLSLE